MQPRQSNASNRLGSARASRADAGALAGMNFLSSSEGKVRFGEGAKTGTRGACATLRTISSFIVAGAIALGLPAFSARAGDVRTQAQDEESIRSVITAFGEAFRKLDAHAFSMVFHEDADFTNVWGMSAHGRKAIEDFHRPLLEGDGSKGIPSFKHALFKVLDTRIRFLRPDVASVDATWSQTGAVLDGKDMGARKGLLMLIVTKEGGAWGIPVMHNMDLPALERP